MALEVILPKAVCLKPNFLETKVFGFSGVFYLGRLLAVLHGNVVL